MQKVLVTGGSHSELPLIEALKRIGFFVITTGTNVDGLGHKAADKYCFGDFSDKEFILNLAKKEHVSSIVSGCNDFAYLSTAYACEKLNFKGHDSYKNAKIIHNKDEFKQVCKEIGVKVPSTYRCKTIRDCKKTAEIIGFPLIIKPSDLTGGKGVTKCENEESLENAYYNAINCTRKDYIVLEEYIEGENHGASFLVKNDKVRFSFFDNEQYYLNKYLVSGASYPSNLSEKTKNELKSSIEKVFKKLDLADGLFHVQFIKNIYDEPVIIDPCRRSPGDLYILFVKYSTGVDYPMEVIKAEIGLEIDDEYSAIEKNIARECIMTDSNGIFKKTVIDSEISDRSVYSLLLAQENDVIDDYKKFKAGIIIFEAENIDKLNDLVNNFQDLACVEKEN